MHRPLQEFSMSLSVAAELVGAELTEGVDKKFTGITHDNRDVEPGDLFVAIPGAHVHGAKFAQNAVERGAVAVITDSTGAEIFQSAPTLVISDVRKAAAILAASFYRYPTRDMQSIGITGTNGKTTVSTLLYQIFEAAGRDTGLIGTVETKIGKDTLTSKRTTPEATELQALAATMRERHMRHLVMEVSSHAMVLNRVRGCFFSVVAFTNLTQDHLDFHGDMESYFQAKASLFTPEYAEHGYVSIDTPYGLRLAENSKIAITTVSRLNPKATWHFAGLRSNAHGSEIKVRGVGGILIESNTSLVGSYNLDNLLLAVAIAYECGIDPIELSQIIPTLKGAPGRLDSVDVGQEFKALVDYAHSPDAVENVLRAAREFTSGKIIAILGCGGDRDRTKRPLMGMALSKGADIAIFTSDNPRSENPSEILNEMTFGLGVSGPSRIIEDRAAAIQYAVSIAKAGDTVLVLGKGHELGQESMGNITPFDDRLQLAQAIEARS